MTSIRHLLFLPALLLAALPAALLSKPEAEGSARQILRLRYMQGKLSEADFEELLEQCDS